MRPPQSQGSSFSTGSSSNDYNQQYTSEDNFAEKLNMPAPDTIRGTIMLNSKTILDQNDGKSLSKKILEDLKTHAAICSEEPIRSLYLQDIRCSSASVANELWETVIDCADSN